MERALVTPDLLTWARQRCGFSVGEVSKKLNVKTEAVAEWESGTYSPTFQQAQNLANILHVPFGYFFLSQPPSQILPISDRRTSMAGQQLPDPSPALVDVLYEMMNKQQWYREYREAELTNAEVGRFSVTDSTEEVAAHIREAIGLEQARSRPCSWDKFLKEITRALENSGVMVMRSGVVGNNTHRPIDVEEFRGFVLSDDVAPLIFLNSRDSVCAQTFTLAHEIALVWVGESGLSNADYRSARREQDDYVAQFCNQVAMDLLTPPSNYARESSKTISRKGPSDRYPPSSDVVANVYVGGIDVGGIDVATFDMTLVLPFVSRNGQIDSSRHQTESQASRSSEDAFYRVLVARNGTLLTHAVVSCLSDETILYKEAADLLSVKPKTLPKLMGFVSSNWDYID